MSVGLDTDRFGTFTGEVARVGTAEETVREKARAGMRAAGLPLGLASEGSFGPHPQLGLVPIHQELLVFIDDELGLEVLERSATTATNFAHTTAAPGDDLEGFLKAAGFPRHGLIVRPNRGEGQLTKGISDFAALADAVRRASEASVDRLARLETDMRALFNPMRLRVIKRLAVALARRLRTPCPECGAPGWGVCGLEPGLPCRDCEAATYLTRFERYCCSRCALEQLNPRRDGLEFAEPDHCLYCNP